MELTLKIRRQQAPSANTGAKPSFDSYKIDVDPKATVFDALTRVREEQDGSLAFRGNCYTGFCGDCVMRANGQLTLMCQVTIEKSLRRTSTEGEITIDSAPYAAPVRDVQVNNQRFLWDKFRLTQPWIRTNGTPAKAVTEESMAQVRMAMRCTMCGLCDFGCTVIDVDTSFVGPAALTKGWRFLMDPRDTADKERLSELGEPRGMWDCVHCWEASEHCPVGIDPTHRIMEMRDIAVMAGVRSGHQNPQVARHTDSMIDSVKHSGWLDEKKLAMDTTGLIGSVKYIGTAWKLWRRGKISLIGGHEKRPGAEQIGEYFDKANLK